MRQEHTAPEPQSAEHAGSIVSVAAVLAAGLAAATAAVVTSTLGAAGTLAGTVLTAMVATASAGRGGARGYVLLYAVLHAVEDLLRCVLHGAAVQNRPSPSLRDVFVLTQASDRS